MYLTLPYLTYSTIELTAKLILFLKKTKRKRRKKQKSKKKGERKKGRKKEKKREKADLWICVAWVCYNNNNNNNNV